MKKSIINYIFLLLIFGIGLYSQNFINLYKEVVFNTNLIILIVTLIAGLFGFIIAVIPFAIQLFNQEYNDKKLLDEFEVFSIPMLRRFIKALKIMLYFFIFLFLLHTIQTIDSKLIKLLDIKIKKCLIIILFSVYLIFINIFFQTLKNIIRDLDTMVSIFINKKRKDLNKS